MVYLFKATSCMKQILTASLLLFTFIVRSQNVNIQPSISPAVFEHNETITVTYNVTGTSLSTLTEAWIWVWIPGKNIDAKYNINPAAAAAQPAKFTYSAANKTFTLTFKPSDFFNQSIANETKLGMLLKANEWGGGQTVDFIANIGYQITLTKPAAIPAFVDNNETLPIEATAPVASDFSLYINNSLISTATGVTTFSYSHLVTETSGFRDVQITAVPSAGGSTKSVNFQYIISQPSPALARPTGIKYGINYKSTDATKVTLCLWAPGKTSAYVRGDFSSWNVLPQYVMNRDGETFWIELTGLTPGQEYGFQYLVDESLKLADPFADKILDPDDQYIDATTYPDLKAYPEQARSTNWYENRVSVFQTNQTAYAWQKLDFVRPAKESLVIYELLIRDFFGAGNRNYQNLIDTIPYFKRLGVNAIELMPIMEFNGNESWGYNPTFMFAPDKSYGTKNKLKEFIDQCHINGIAVILDIAMNHQDTPNPLVLMDFDFTTFKPTANNKWFNINATHPFSVFYDMNHESSYTKAYLDTVNLYWLNEYKIDGFRFDLSKGFTQRNTPNDVGAWSNYDASRVALLKRMADKIWAQHPTAYVVLEHLAANVEEVELADYRANEGKGMMLWGKMTDQYNQNTMGFAENSSISGGYHGTRGWSKPNLVGYMESHDEERLMYKNKTFGRALGSYNVKNLPNALWRMQAASAAFYTVPGPKMLWQFGEMGYDESINRCTNGSIGDCRLAIKPTRWEYLDDQNRQYLFKVTSDLIRLKLTHNVFQNGTATFSVSNQVHQVSIRNKNYTTAPLNASEMSAVVVSNFSLEVKEVTIVFPHAGNWFEYFSGTPVNVSGSSITLNIGPGGYRLFTNFQLEAPLITDLENENTGYVFPNPTDGLLSISISDIREFSMISTTGQTFKPVRVGEYWDVRSLLPGLYIGSVRTDSKYYKFRILIKH